MYTPKHFEMKDIGEIHDFIDKNSFGILVSRNDGRLTGSHIPMLLKKDEGQNGFLYGHIARANHQRINAEEDVLVIFPCAHKYISSSWYETNQSVPTWNYLSVHIYGKIKFTESREEKEKIVRDVVEYFEEENSSYNVDDLKPEYFEGLLKGITAFKIEIVSFEGKKKLSQNHGEERRQRIISKLDSMDDDDSKEISRRMKNFESRE